ncbi:Gfo/Idh/MocA family oxidoreductase [Paenibacillus sp. CGMCC 1.16610]|uniref:Gfo/Idh/MocA family oxidoreductase n=1 Tax=Paenibacillus anseongense TaxID=2682845 RepID=A0ABW9U3N7_9BACL|nr:MULTISPECIES: Gfo/Idh/MocA family oxidoreductase [Paenibacillus]MBA2938719.1 Gfo/Idh/MocA family oxidoreductase [Paenibacillus sp. CGMCC 1.16610]MVQ34682.1 gfo/Idh/MocA family oxidoreductase [Paenibacillus anseongense]
MNNQLSVDFEFQHNHHHELPVTAIIVGAGHRSLIYASFAEVYPKRFKIVGVVEPDSERRHLTKERFGLSEDNCFADITELVGKPKIADAVINGTMDHLHVSSSIPLLRAGYDIMLEKPIGVSREEVMELYEEAKRLGRKVMICHVLRYAPFYESIRQTIADGIIGDIVSLATTENVTYHHMAMAYVRGKWGRVDKGGSSMLMAKSCHDLDVLAWMKGDVEPVKVSSFGSLLQFRPEKAPSGAGTRCLVDCSIEESCPYSARKHYIEQRLWTAYVTYNTHLGVTMSDEELAESLRKDSPYGRCVWRCDNDVVDHQTVIVEFEDGSTGTHVMTGGTSKPGRSIHIVGTKGEIQGDMEAGSYVIRHPDARKGHIYSEQQIKVGVSEDMHGGGDLLLVDDFVKVLKGDVPSISSTSLEKSLYGHFIGFAADQSRLEQRTVAIKRV